LEKNWLYAGSERAAAIQSLLGTANLNGLDSDAWLKSTLEKLPTCPNSDIDKLLPFRSASQGVVLLFLPRSIYRCP
jgi:transposase